MGKKVCTSAPGKAILFGEHAVVYGEPAISAALDLRVSVEAAVGEREIFIRSEGIPPEDEYELRYVRKAVEIAFERAGETTPLDLHIRSQLPVASGLGSSAATTVATILAVCRLLGEDLGAEEIARLGHRVEREVQGGASPTDTLTSTLGGVLFIQPLRGEFEPMDVESFPLLLGYTGIRRETGTLVADVRRLHTRHPRVVDPILRSIGVLTREARGLLERREEGIGELMNINQGLLEALGVGTRRLSDLVYAAREAGAAGAKITGAGGGGCILAYAPGASREVLQAIEAVGGRGMRAGITREGVRLEKKGLSKGGRKATL
jgi:mevalonate kinase